MEDGTLIEWKKKPGDTVETRRYNRRGKHKKDLSKLRYSMKASLINFIQEGTKVPVGTVMAHYSRGVSLDTKKEKKLSHCNQPKKNNQSTPASTAEIRKNKVSPLARRIAEENHIRLESVKGTGPDGAITKEDVDHVKNRKN
jgi:pyruvate dehydrogenase E2 component (dihydrolipoamide acetyltransferase)